MITICKTWHNRKSGNDWDVSIMGNLDYAAIEWISLNGKALRNKRFDMVEKYLMAQRLNWENWIDDLTETYNNRRFIK